MSTPSSIIDKLAKLLKHQESAAAIGSIAEAEAFAGKIQELLTRHKLEMSDIQFTEQEAAELIDCETVLPKDLGVKQESKRIEWQEDLARAIARSNDCSILINNNSNWAFFVGRKTDREICIRLHGYFLTLIDEIGEEARYDATGAEKARTGYKGADLQHHMKMFQQSFCTGMSDAIQTRIYERRRALENAVAKESTALIHLRNTREQINAYMEERFKDRKPSKAKDRIDTRASHGGAYKAGLEKGNAISLTSGAIE